MKLEHIFRKDWWLGHKIEEKQVQIATPYPKDFVHDPNSASGMSLEQLLRARAQQQAFSPPPIPKDVLAIFTDDKGFTRQERVQYPPSPTYRFAVIPALQASYITGDSTLNTPGVSPYAETMTFIEFRLKGMSPTGQALYTIAK